MKAIRRFTVRTALPGPLEPLGELVFNLRWSWHPATRELFASIDPRAWGALGEDPARLLGEVTPERLAELSADEEFSGRLHAAAADLHEYLTGPRWYQSLPDAPAGIAYFSPEFGITTALPQYSGGLGILAGDHLKTASDLGVPVIGVGLLYRHGYFTQSLSREGWQLERYPPIDPNGLPLTLLRDADQTPVRVTLPLPDGRHLAAQVWTAQVGRIPLLLLDSYVADNDPAARDVTDRLYGGGTDHRLHQEMLLGIGGVRAIRAYCRITGHPAPEVFHTNEGHAGFLGVERIREYINDEGLSYEEALEATRAGTIFTTHTPVPAGIDRFPRSLVEEHFAAGVCSGVPVDPVIALGAETYPGGDPDLFNMAVMGLRLAGRSNGVSELHGRVSREMFGGLWPGFDVSEVPITSITNGVHAATWVGRELLELADREIGVERLGRGEGWDRIEDASDAEVWAIRGKMRARLVSRARSRLAESWRQRGASEAELRWIDDALDPDVLTVGFARRVPSYKRLTLMLRDPQRLTALLTDPQRPIQIVIAGKAHPADDGGKRLIQQIVQFADDHDVRHRIVFLPDYDMELGRALVQGCDVWMNNPLRPLEACGTSGMKAALNGGLNLSIKDGWWDEWFDGANGWAIPSADGLDDPDRRDDLEAAALYDLLEEQVRARFYDRDADGLPRRWLEMVKHTLRTLGPKTLASRMLREYVTELYQPVAAASRRLSADSYAGVKELAAWKRRVTKAWPGLRIEHVEAADGDEAPRLGSRLEIRATVALGELSPDDVAVEAVYGRVDEADEVSEPNHADLSVTHAEGGVVSFAGSVALDRAGAFGYSVRILPRHRLLTDKAELGLVVVPEAPAGMTNGDLR